MVGAGASGRGPQMTAEEAADLEKARARMIERHKLIEAMIRNNELHHAADYTPYEGREVRAWPAMTLSRGVTVWADGQFRGRAGHGRFLRCERPDVVTSQVKAGTAAI